MHETSDDSAAHPKAPTPVPSALKEPLFHIDTPEIDPDHVVYSPMPVSGWFVDARLNGAARIRVRLGAITAICDRVERPDVTEHFKPVSPSLGAVGFSVQIRGGLGQQRLIIEAETPSGEIIPLKDQQVIVKAWPPQRSGLRKRLIDLRRRWTWARSPGPTDSVLVLIPVKPGAPPAASARARALAERALQSLPANSRVVLDERGIPAASRNEHPWRIAALAAIRQGMIDHHLRDERWVFWADLDVVDYPADLITTLIRRARCGIAAPLVLMANAVSPRGGPRFFDLAGFVEEGRWATMHPPFFRQPGPVYDLDSVGCCYLIAADLYRRGARHEEDPGSRRWIETHGASAADTSRRDWTDLAYTDHYSVCAFARQHGLPVRAFGDLIALHEHLS